MDCSGEHFIYPMCPAVHSKQVCDDSSPTVSLPSFEKLLPPFFKGMRLLMELILLNRFQLLMM